MRSMSENHSGATCLLNDVGTCMRVSVIDISDPTFDVETPSFQQQMEERLAAMYSEGVEREDVLHNQGFMSYKKRRRRRWATDDDVTIQVRLRFRG